MSADLWVCPDCAFAFAAEHTDADGGYTCPACNEAKLAAELERLRAERDDLLWMVGHLLGDQAALPPRLFRLANKAAEAYDPTRYTLVYWEDQ